MTDPDHIMPPIQKGSGGMKVDPILLLGLLDEVGRLRALNDTESQLLEMAILKEAKPIRRLHKWTRDEDRELLRVQFRRRGVAELAHRIGVSESAAWSRVQALRHPHKRRVKPILVEG